MLPDPFCERLLTSQDREIVVQIGRPEQVAHDEWKCAYWVTGLFDVPQYATGIDSLQAVVQAIAHVRVALQESASSFAWLGEEGEHGIPVMVPTSFSNQFSRNIEHLIEKEIEGFYRGVSK